MPLPSRRWNKGLLWPAERGALLWLAAHMPQWVTPDLLTGIGFLGAMVTFAGYAWSGTQPVLLWVATLGLAINWFGDSLDGTLARARKIERPRYGYYLDNAIDCLAALLLAADWLSSRPMNCHGLEFRLLRLLIPDTTSTPFFRKPDNTGLDVPEFS